MSEKKNYRILISGYEIGGQMQLIAETLRNRWIQATAVSYNVDYRGYQNDVMLARKGFRGTVNRFLFFLWASNHYDVFHFFWGHSMLNFWRFRMIDVPILRLLGKKVIVHFRGLDVVDIAYFDFKRSLSRGEKVEPPPISRPEQIKSILKWKKYADLVLVSEPDLHFVSENSILIPQVIDMNYWKSEKEPLSKKDGIIRIVHAPSSRRKKGTDFVELAILNLKKRGFKIELILAEKLPHDKIKELYAQSDIGVDQVLYGWHGKVSVELMALGKPVICNIDPEYAKYRPDLPIIHGDPGNLEQVLEDLIVNPEIRRRIGEESVIYAHKYHNVESVVDELSTLYGMSEKTKYKTEILDAKTW